MHELAESAISIIKIEDEYRIGLPFPLTLTRSACLILGLTS